MTEPPRSRRAEYAAATHAAIIDAARLLFARNGYFATKVEDIAAEARVAPATVYAVTGGKRGLIRTLVDRWSQAPIIAQTLSRQETLTDPDEILRRTASVVRDMRETYGDIVRLILTTAPHDTGLAEDLRVATRRYRDAIEAVAVRLRDVGGLRAGMTVAEATDILWFYFGYSGYFTLVDDNGWTYEQAERWLVAQAAAALR
ncbi:TetR/AcrR family transcriptional regulator [Streptosporangium sp. NPDC004379]|uniref:TetR/AcrR family transcriptional regulator n=1 Tax=Streptosporangium sp. NPDC004379 TaxID=3366189 RepID=UPI0036AB3CE9